MTSLIYKKEKKNSRELQTAMFPYVTLQFSFIYSFLNIFYIFYEKGNVGTFVTSGALRNQNMLYAICGRDVKNKTTVASV